MGSKSAFLAGHLILSEEATDDILDHRAELMEEIEGLEAEIHELYGIKDTPQQIELCKKELESFEEKKKDIEAGIKAFYEEEYQKTKASLDNEKKKLQGRNEKYKKTAEEMKGEIKALQVEKKDLEESIHLLAADIEQIKKDVVNTEGERDAILEKTNVLLEEVEVAQAELEDDRKFVNESLVVQNNDKKLFKVEVEGFEKEKLMTMRTLTESLEQADKREKELDLRTERDRENVDTQKAECKVSRREIEAIGEKQETERNELRALRAVMDKREEVLSKREEDLDTNWTIFEREKNNGKN